MSCAGCRSVVWVMGVILSYPRGDRMSGPLTMVVSFACGLAAGGLINATPLAMPKFT